MPESPDADYLSRFNRVFDHIRAHLDEDLSLERLARLAHFSPFHFHRVFKALTSETLAQFVKRVRLERALYLLSHGPQSLTEIALSCGFTSSSDFSRSFKARYGVAPSRFDVERFREERRADWSKALESPEVQRLTRLPAGENPDGFTVELVSLPRRIVRYIRVAQPYSADRVTDAAARLVKWAEARGSADGQWLGWSWEDPDLVSLEQCFYDVGVVVTGDVAPEGEVGHLVLEPMRVAEVSLDGPIELEQRAIDWLFGSWLPTSGFVPAHQPTFEAWDGRPFSSGVTSFRLKLQLPICPPHAVGPTGFGHAAGPDSRV